MSVEMTTVNTPSQLNTDIAPEELVRVKRDVLDVGTSMKEYVRVSLLHFRQSLTKEQRRAKFAGKSKILGRPL